MPGSKQVQRASSTPQAPTETFPEANYVNVKLLEEQSHQPLDLSIYDTIDARRAASLTYENTRMHAPSSASGLN